MLSELHVVARPHYATRIKDFIDCMSHFNIFTWMLCEWFAWCRLFEFVLSFSIHLEMWSVFDLNGSLQEVF